jgi:hypothetical protein
VRFVRLAGTLRRRSRYRLAHKKTPPGPEALAAIVLAIAQNS